MPNIFQNLEEVTMIKIPKVYTFLFCLIITVLIFTENIYAIGLDRNLRPIRGLNTYLEDSNHGEKVIYLTFDDGPSAEITGKVLDILKENNVKATFFLIGNQIEGLEPVVTRIHNEGHSIGLHTYTHKFSKIYSNNDSFIAEMNKCQNKIEEVVNISPTIIRFPGGSRKHLTNNFLISLHNNNFKIYDWNMETLDGIDPTLSSYKIFKDATNNTDNLSTIMLLLHCDTPHKNTCTALPAIIQYYKDQGYVFKTITNDTPELYFPIKK
jgi:peptidoglycan/xylan/chitin deacetylase (PgdA/CDA1 family)